MPRIPDASQLGYNTPQIRTPRFQRGAGSVGAANAAANFAGTIGQSAEFLQEREDTFAFAQAKSKYALADIEARKATQDWYEAERAKSAEPQFFKMPPQQLENYYNERMKRAQEDSVTMIRSQRDRAAFDASAKLNVAAGTADMRQFGKQKKKDADRASLSFMLDSNRRVALEASDEPTRANAVRNVQAALDGAVVEDAISSDESQAMGKAWTLSYAEGYVDTLPLRKQIEVLSKPDGTPASLLQPDRRSFLLKQAKNQQRIEDERAEANKTSKLVEVRQALHDQMSDLLAGAENGLQLSPPSEAILKTAYGDREGERMWALAEKAVELSGDMASLHQLPTADIQARAESYRPKIGSTVSVTDQDRLHAVISRGVAAIVEQRKQDPAGYLVKHAPATSAAWDQLQLNPTDENRDAYIAAIDADVERLGMLRGDLLPNSTAKLLASEIASEKSPEKLAAILASESAKWGDRWPDIHNQIAKDLPDVAAVIGSGIDKTAAVNLAKTLNLKDTELSAMLPPGTTWNALRQAVGKEFADVRKSFPAQGARTFGAIEESAMRLSLTYMQAGDSESSAITRAYNDLIGNQYNIGSLKDVTFLVPKNFDVSDIETEAEDILRNFKPPRDIVGNADPLRVQQSYRDDAYWVMDKNGDGLRMYINATKTNIVYTYQQLADMAAARRERERQNAESRQGSAMRARGL